MHELRLIGFVGIVLAMFVDDSRIGVFQHMDLVTEIQNDLAAMLGLVYKTAKDELDVSSMKFIGFDVWCTETNIQVRLPQDSNAKLVASISEILRNTKITTLGTLESVIGKLQHASTVIVELRQFLRSSYDAIARMLTNPPDDQFMFRIWRKDLASRIIPLSQAILLDLS